MGNFLSGSGSNHTRLVSRGCFPRCLIMQIFSLKLKVSGSLIVKIPFQRVKAKYVAYASSEMPGTTNLVGWA
jgi:hypothetical protein